MTLDKDAYNVQLGCVLLQEKPVDTTQPIQYWSRLSTDAEKRYDTTQSVLPCDSIGHLLLRPYLQNYRFTIGTDHEALKWILNQVNFTGRLTSWCLSLSEFDYDVLHRAYIKHQTANALSQLATIGEEKSPLEDYILLNATNSHTRQTRPKTSKTISSPSRITPPTLVKL